MEKERIAKWDFTQETGILALTNSKTKEIVGKVDLTEIPGWNELPEFAKFYLQYGIKQKVSDPNAGEKGENKLEGMRLGLEAWKEITFARAKTEKGESISLSKIKAQVWSLKELRLMKEMFGKLEKGFPAEMEAKLEELEQQAVKAAKKN